MISTSIYQDIATRAGGDIYAGVVGPVRTGKSTFIKRFMDVLVFPNMANPYEKTRVMDELPQSGEGKTITTTEPKFIPPEAVRVNTKGGAGFNVRLVDCVAILYQVRWATWRTERREWSPLHGLRNRCRSARRQK